jgi:hypothetical protein
VRVAGTSIAPARGAAAGSADATAFASSGVALSALDLGGSVDRGDSVGRGDSVALGDSAGLGDSGLDLADSALATSSFGLSCLAPSIAGLSSTRGRGSGSAAAARVAG